MKTSSKTKATAIALSLTLSLAASMMLLPTANAHTPAWKIPTYANIHAAPNPVGVNQPVSIYLWLTNYYYGSQVNNDLKFHNYKLTITAPNGAVTTQNFPVITDPTSNQHTSFVPDQVGVYTLEFTYPGQTYTQTTEISYPLGSPVGPNQFTNDTFMPSSAAIHLTVQEEQLPAAIGGYPLPTEYWTRPIYGENTNWWEISSNWLGLGAPNYGGWMNTGQDALSGPNTFMQVYPGDAIGSQTPHVMWTKSMQSGGVVGGNNFDIQGQTFFDGSAYIIRYNNPIILAGKLYYTETVGFSNTGYRGSSSGPTDCVDLRTGKLLWSRTDVPPLHFGLLMDVQTVNEHGVSQPLLIADSSWFPSPGNYWSVFDGDTGTPLCNVTNIPGYTNALYGNPPAPWLTGSGRAMGPDGEYLDYIFANAGDEETPDWRLGEWNSSLLFLPKGSAAPTFNANPVLTASFTIDAGISDQSDPNCRYDWNISAPYLNTMTSPFIVVSAKYGDGILMMNGTMPSNGENALYGWVSSAPYTYFFVNLNASRDTVGRVLWWSTLQAPANNYTVVQGPVDWETRVITQDYKEAAQWVGYSLEDGKYLWTAPPQTALDYYGSTSEGTLPGACAYGHLYSSAYGGILYCYDDKTGDLLWTYGNGGEGNSTSSGFNWPYGNIPTQIQAIGNGVVYTVTSVHTWTSPIYKGGLARAVNATDGSEIWTISGVTMEFGMMSYAMADGYNTWFNGYDDQIYVVGRGPSATTVSAPDTAAAFGTPVVIKGTVMDISTGTTQDEQAARFPNGVPAMSDASMTAWMGYIYQQKPLPADAVGVNVTLSVFDSNNNCYDIGTATTDADGFFYYTWTPTIPGDFKVIATFAGSNGYWPSHAETAFTVMQAPAATPAPTPQPASIADMYFLPMSIVTIILIVIVGVVLFLMLRKR
jgi:outer membrane protein assembly factor BamB